MNVCELRLYNSSGVIIDRIGFLASPFSLPENIRIPKAQKRQSEVGNNLFGHGSEIRESKYANSVISLQPTIILESCTDDEAALYIEKIRARFEYILDEAQRWSTRRTTNYVRFAEDTKGFVLESEIIDGDFDIQDDWSRSNLNSGIIASASLSMVRRPFRMTLDRETIDNYVVNPSFEFSVPQEYGTGVGQNKYAGWITSGYLSYQGDGGSVSYTDLRVPQDSVDGDKSVEFSINGDNGSTLSHIAFRQTVPQRFPATGTLMYAEAWVCATGYDADVKTYLQAGSGDGFGTGDKSTRVYWINGDTPTYKDHRWYRSRQDNEEDLSTTREFSDKVHFWRKGFFFLASAYTVFGTELGISIHLKAKAIYSQTRTSSAYFDKIYMTQASNFLSGSRYDTMLARLSSVDHVAVDPGTYPTDIDYMPKAWGSGGIINQVYDHSDGTTNYLDLDGVGGDVPARAEVTVSHALAAVTGDTISRARMFTAGMTSKGLPYKTRDRLTRDAYPGGIPTVNTLDSISSQSVTVVSGASTYNETNQKAFSFSTGVDRDRIAGSYHAFLRYYPWPPFGPYDPTFYARTAIPSGNSIYTYGREVVLDHHESTTGFVWADLGVVEIPDLQDDAGFIIYVQIRGGLVSGVELDALTLIPADEWIVSVFSNIKLTSSYFIRSGSLDGRDNIPAMIGGPSNYPAAYLSGSTPFLMPDRINRIYFTINFSPEVSQFTYFVSRKIYNDPYYSNGIIYFSKVKYQELYL